MLVSGVKTGMTEAGVMGGGVHTGQTKPEADEVCHSEIDAIPDEVGQTQFELGSFVVIR